MSADVVERDMMFIRDCENPSRLPVIYVAGVDYPVWAEAEIAGAVAVINPPWWKFWR